MPILPIGNPEDIDLLTVSTEYPTLAAGTYTFKVGEVTVEQQKSGNGQNLVLKCAIEQQAHDTKGNVIQPGYVITHRVNLTEGEKRSKEQIARSIAELQDAILGHRVALSEFDTDQFIGQTFVATTRVDAATEKYPESAGFRKFIKKG